MTCRRTVRAKPTAGNVCVFSQDETGMREQVNHPDGPEDGGGFSGPASRSSDDVPGVGQRQVPIIQKIQKTVEIPQLRL